jgi:glycine dehydrogenase subunit 2
MSGMKLRRYHAHVWNEPIIMEMTNAGRRGLIVAGTGDQTDLGKEQSSPYIPNTMRRRHAPKLPEISQPEVVRHYLRLSQQTLGAALNVDIGRGTCTMKYSPVVNEELLKLPQFAFLHPLQDENTVQGILEIIYRFSRFLAEISGLDEFTFQPGGGAHAVHANALMISKYHECRGEARDRDEIITTLYSHPANAASPATAGYKIVTLYPDPETGYPDVEALKAAVSRHTAGLMITNPEDTGIFNPMIDEFVRIVHEVGGLCAYDQANANTLFGVARAKEAGFDMCHFNLHKTFSSPHGCMGPACGAVGVKKNLGEFLPVPVVTFDGTKYHLDCDRPRSIGKVRQFAGNIETVVRAYAWVMNLGPEGLRQVSDTSIINTNYLIKRMSDIRGISMAYPEQKIRLDQARFSFQKLKEETGVGTADVGHRIVDFGINQHFTSHHPWTIPEPITPEPCESYSKEDIDYWTEIIRHVCEEAYASPETAKTAPHNQPIAKINEDTLNDPNKWAMTWAAYLRKWRTQKQ